MNCGIGAMGPYNHANATIGRAFGLLSQNLQGGSVPGETYMGSQGNNYAITASPTRKMRKEVPGRRSTSSMALIPATTLSAYLGIVAPRRSRWDFEKNIGATMFSICCEV
jgi:hypothetical protein